MKRSARILTAIAVTIALGSMSAYQDAKKNDLAFQSHPTVVIATDFFCGLLAASIFYIGSGWLAKRRGKSNSRDDEFYDQVAKELNDQDLIPGVWTKAYADMNGDESKARALYIRYRVQELRNKQIEARSQQLKDAHLNEKKMRRQARLKAKEARRATEAAKPSLTPFLKVSNVIVAIPCACISILMTFACLGVIVDLIGMLDTGRLRHVDPDSAIGFVFGIPFLGLLAFGFGWFALKCFKDATRSNSHSQQLIKADAKEPHSRKAPVP